VRVFGLVGTGQHREASTRDAALEEFQAFVSGHGRGREASEARGVVAVAVHAARRGGVRVFAVAGCSQ